MGGDLVGWLAKVVVVVQRYFGQVAVVVAEGHPVIVVVGNLEVAGVMGGPLLDLAPEGVEVVL